MSRLSAFVVIVVSLGVSACVISGLISSNWTSTNVRGTGVYVTQTLDLSLTEYFSPSKTCTAQSISCKKCQIPAMSNITCKETHSFCKGLSSGDWLNNACAQGTVALALDVVTLLLALTLFFVETVLLYRDPVASPKLWVCSSLGLLALVVATFTVVVTWGLAHSEWKHDFDKNQAVFVGDLTAAYEKEFTNVDLKYEGTSLGGTFGMSVGAAILSILGLVVQACVFFRGKRAGDVSEPQSVGTINAPADAGNDVFGDTTPLIKHAAGAPAMAAGYKSAS